MCAEEQDLAVLIENILRAVAVMDIPIDDEHAFGRMFVARISSGDGHVIEQTKAHAYCSAGVVAWRANDAEGILHFARKDGIDCG